MPAVSLNIGTHGADPLQFIIGKAARSSSQLGVLIGFVKPGVVKQPL